MPKNLLTYSIFIIACLVVVAAFITATTFIQLAAASLLYPLLILFAYKVLPFGAMWATSRRQVATVTPQVHSHEKIHEEKSQNVGISDINKRAFLKLIGATGLSFFLISVFGRKFEALLFGQNIALPNSALNVPRNQTSAHATASPTDGYKISEIDSGEVGYYGFVNKDGGWLIMREDPNSGSFRYAKGESNLPINWKNRKNLKYDYFHNLAF